MIPATFSVAWRAAIERGDASQFASQSDLAAFFRATSMIGGCFKDLPDEQRDRVVSLRERFPAAIAEARATATREREAEGGPRYIIGRSNPGHVPTLAELQPELDAIDTELGKIVNDDKRGDLNSLAAAIYARRNRKG